MVKLKIEALSAEVDSFYKNHNYFHPGDSGLDLFVIQDQTIKAGEFAFVNLGFKAAAFDNDKNVSWLVMPRSSICKTPLRLANSIGLIDAGYRGEIKLAVDNIKSEDYTLTKGDRIVQAVAFNGEPLTIELVSKLDDTVRGEGGFGSTLTNGKVSPCASIPESKKAKITDENSSLEENACSVEQTEIY